MGTKRDLVAYEAKRLQGIELLRQGLRPAEIARRSGVSRQAVSQWVQAYRRGGLAALARVPHRGRPPRLTARQRQRLAKMLRQGAGAHGYSNDLWSGRRVAQLIAEKFGVTLHHKHLPRLLRVMGWTCRKPVGRAVERDEAAVARWIARDWPRLKKNSGGRARRSSA